MDIPSELIAQFCSVTNADESLASQLLRDSGLDLEGAIQSFFAIQEAGGLPNEAPSSPPAPPDVESPPDPEQNAPSSPPPADNPDHDVRLPIPQMLDTLLTAPPTRRFPEPPTADPFVDSNSTDDRLSELFRRPTHLTFSGSFEEAMTAGQLQRHWLLVNMQRPDVFPCHVMNRDVWSDPSVEELLQAHFIFWQRDERYPDGRRYKDFYRYDEPPHVALIDPRSGERLRVWGGDGRPIAKDMLLAELVDFVTTNSLSSNARIPQSNRTGQPSTRAPRAENAASSTPADMDTDDAGLAEAIAASMEDPDAVEAMASADQLPLAQNGRITRPDSDANRQASRLLSATDPALSRTRSLRAQQDNEFEESLALDRALEESKKAEAQRIENAAEEEMRRAKQAEEARDQKRRRVPPLPPADTTEKVTELAIRLPNGQRLQRRFFASNTIGSVYDYIESECEDLAHANFELMQPYPKKSFAVRDVSLMELAPKAALVVHLID